ncbi:MAG: hypothetical protein M1829_001476 [Trizodia sp. TS-e1964]|nr:MAG: hypothetical protein M1829_001476 [Trizodia sp. TS-e1964]
MSGHYRPRPFPQDDIYILSYAKKSGSSHLSISHQDDIYIPSHAKKSGSSHLSISHQDDYYRPSHTKQPASSQPSASRKASPPKELQKCWAHLRFIDASGTAQSLRRLGAVNGPSFCINLCLSLAPINADISFRGMVTNGKAGSKQITQDYIASYPTHGVPNMFNNDLLFGYTDLVLKHRSIDSDFPSPPLDLEAGSKITHYLLWNATSALTTGWNASVNPDICLNPNMIADLEIFHLLDRATRIEVWLVGAALITSGVEALCSIRRPFFSPPLVGYKAGEILNWKIPLPPPANGTFKSEKAIKSFTDAEQYEMIMKTAISHKRETVVHQTEALLMHAHTLALVHLNPAKVLPRDENTITANADFYKAYVKLRIGHVDNIDTAPPKLDTGLKVELTWTRASDAAYAADVVLILRKPKNLPAPFAAEPSETITSHHIHDALLKAQLNETSAKRQFKAVSAVARNAGSLLWESLLNHKVVAPAFQSHTLHLGAVVRDCIEKQLARELAADEIKQNMANSLIEARELEEFEAERNGITPETRVMDASSLLDGLNIAANSNDNVTGSGRENGDADGAANATNNSEWKPDAPIPDAPSMVPVLAVWEKSSRELREEEDKRIEEFDQKQELSRREALENVDYGCKVALKLAESLNSRQKLAFYSSCGPHHGFTLLTGPPGTGKSFLIKQLVVAYTAVGMCALVTAPSNDEVNNLAFILFQGAKKERLHFSNKNSLGLYYEDVVRVYPEQDEYRSAKFHQTAEQSDQVLLHLMQAEAEADSDSCSVASLKHLSLARRIRRLAYNSPRTPDDPWREYREIFAGNMQLRTFRECYWEIANAIMARAKIVLSTLNTCQIPVITNNIRPNLVVIDEAAQASEQECLIPFVQEDYNIYCRFLAGDEKQLPPTVLSARSNERAEQLALSLFFRLKATGTLTCTLVEQFRMAPSIPALPNRVMYGNKLLNHASTLPKNRPISGDFLRWASEMGAPKSNRLFFNVVKSNCMEDVGTKSRYNPAHLAATVKLLLSLLDGPQPLFRPAEVQVLCFYKVQRNRLIEYLWLRSSRDRTNLWASVSVSTVDSYQGKEKEVVIVDLVVKGGGALDSVGFVRNDPRLNVAITRARRPNHCRKLGRHLARDAIESGETWDTYLSTRDWHTWFDRVQQAVSKKRDFGALSTAFNDNVPDLDA